MPKEFLCRISDLVDGQSKGLVKRGNDDAIFVVRQGDDVFCWLNDCPHEHRPLEYKKDRFLNSDGRHIVCYAHSAHFDLRTGVCFDGPCKGEALIRVESSVVDGDVMISAELPSIF
jgi:nitrite reductase/ring-hydroxylating ferredoxin subunit